MLIYCSVVPKRQVSFFITRNYWKMQENYLNSARKQFLYYKMLGQKTIERLSEAQIFWQYNEQSNSIAVIVKHLTGNMRSRWTDFLTTDGEKEWRNREAEFVGDFKDKAELLEKWEDSWQVLFLLM